ncbi:MAG: peptidoglycan bridge formation glycyltransferase FemA/FemB family protein [Patescibacteria group bacterium]
MNIFNSLGSNYTLSSAIRILFSTGDTSAQQKLIEYLEARYGLPGQGGRAILTYKGREALFLAIAALPQGAIAINGFTCLAVYEAITENGRAVHYIDVPENNLNFTPASFQAALVSNPAIKAVIVQNTLGIPCDIQTIRSLCERHGVALIEDLAHSIGTRYSTGEEAGTVGDFVVLSFSQDKVVDAVSGGALIIRNKKYVDAVISAEHVPSLGQQLKDRFYPVLTWKIRVAYALGIGKALHALFRSLHLLSTPFGKMAANDAHALPGWYCDIILQQYTVLEKTAAHRREIAHIYAQYVDKRLQIPADLQRSTNVRFPLLANNRASLIRFLKKDGVHVSDIWYDAPIAPKKYLRRTDYKGQCPHAEHISEMMVNLPTHINVSPIHARTIAESVNKWLVEGTSEYSVTAVADENVWEKYLRAQKPHSFLHAWKWGQHYELSGSKIFRLGVYRGETLVAIALLIKIEARRGSFLLCPHGPIVADIAHEEPVLRVLTEHCGQIAKDEMCAFIRFCPLAKPTPENVMIYHNLGFRSAPIHMHPELAWMLDITKPEDELLKAMRKTTRYLVKRMEKEGVEVVQSVNPADIEKFWPVYEATVERQQFMPFSKSYLQKEFELFAKDNQAAFFFGTYRGEIIAAAIIIFYNGQAFYHHSGSIQKFDDINASYLLQWRVIQEAKRRGCTLYNFWGISPTDRPRHPWAGLSLFKKGFGGFAEKYLHAQDKPLTAKYALNYVVETARRFRRGL